jgi:hypothetical protein
MNGKKKSFMILTPGGHPGTNSIDILCEFFDACCISSVPKGLTVGLNKNIFSLLLNKTSFWT